ncbi:MAG: response regulator [Nitrospirae bacterium]|nr:response regulator [Nitrospirota bacterium]
MALLVIDDEKDCRESLGELLRLAGHKVITADCGEEALKVLRNNNISLMLVDLIMPKMSGEEFIKKAWGEGHIVPVLVVTAVSPWKTAGITELGIGYIRKPYDSKMLLGVVETLLKKTGGDMG